MFGRRQCFVTNRRTARPTRPVVPTIADMRRILIACLFAFAIPLLADDVELKIDSKVMGEQRTVLVHLPQSYRAGSRAYPVLYMTDAPAQFDHTVATATFLARQGRMPEVIVVGVTNTDRTRDLTPTHLDQTAFDGGAPVPFPTSGGGPKFLTFFESELIPKIESSYRTIPYRVFAGHSFGGLFALNALFSRPKLFNAVIAVSPSFTWDDHWALRTAEKFLDANRELNGMLVYTLGDEGDANRKDFEELKKLVTRRAPRGFETFTYYYPDEDHGSVVMPSHHAALKKIFDSWRFPINGADDVKKMFPRAQEHYAQLSKRIGVPIGVPEDIANRIGYLLLQRGWKSEAVEVFRANAAAYPGSPNVHDSLGEALERSGDVAAAKESYAKAVEAGTKTNDPNLAIFRRNFERLNRPQS